MVEAMKHCPTQQARCVDGQVECLVKMCSLCPSATELGWLGVKLNCSLRPVLLIP